MKKLLLAMALITGCCEHGRYTTNEHYYGTSYTATCVACGRSCGSGDVCLREPEHACGFYGRRGVSARHP